ncbi:MAG: hypothetical protein HYR60_07690 [Acidobacteria bacterium]|nr:hypothetical protein [Acidobacteriota bacterium]
MGLTIREKAEYVGTFRGVRVYLMEMLARWVPTTPELEVKVLFGRHIWDLAQHADALGKRAFEIRAPLHYTLRPSEEYQRLLEEISGCQGTAERIHGFYSVILPGLEKRHGDYLAHTDSLQDEPTVRILDRIQLDDARMRRESQALLAEIPLRLADPEWPGRLAAQDSAVTQFVVPGSGVTLAREVAS